MPISRTLRNRAGWLLVVVGIVLLVSSVGQYAYMWYVQRSLERRWIATSHTLDSPPVPSGSESVPDGTPRPALIRLVIPRIDLDDVVVNGTSYRDLLVGPGLLAGTPAPGMRGNSVIAGHRDTFFRHLADLSPNDEILVMRGGAQYRFQVTRKWIVSPEDVSVLAATASPELTLVTCYPTYWIGPAPKRLIVRARLVTSPAAATAPVGAQSPTPSPSR
jgi:LPXTG-site transpeptidase (sortase) family protein